MTFQLARRLVLGVYAALVIVALAAVAVNEVLRAVEGRLAAWRDRS